VLSTVTGTRSPVELTAPQRAAVEWLEGPLMVLAGAGTGKTTVVVERVRHLLATDRALQPENVLVLTYNVKAAGELTDRLEQALGLETASRLWIHNFHSFGNRILADHRSELGLSENADVLDQVGQRLLLRELRPRFARFIYHRTALDSTWTYGRFADLIGRAKDELVTPDEYAAYAAAKREAFDFRYGSDAFGEAVEGIRRRDAEGRLRGIRETRRALPAGQDVVRGAAWREARREVSGGGFATAWGQLTAEQQRLARGLQPTFVRDAEAYDVLRLTEEAEAYATYQQALRERGVLDFGEQQLRTIELLMERPNIVRRYQAQFRHVLVDEFQDANMAQILLLELIGRGPEKPDNVVVVGDDDQSIYRFRGASYAAFERFRERFEKPPAWAPDRATPKVASLPLLENRRSTENVLTAASRLIAHNEPARLKHEPLRATRPAGEPVDLIVSPDDADEADAIVAWIRRTFDALPRPRRWSDIAVLYRKHRHREQIVERLRRQDIPYVVVGGTGLFAVPEVRDVEAALRVATNPTDSVAFVRLLSAGPWRMDAQEILRLTRAADWDGRPLFQAAADILRDRSVPVPVVEPAGGDGPDASEPVAAALADLGLGLDADGRLTLWADDDLAADALGQPETVRERRSRDARTKWRQEQLDIRLRAKLERLFAVLDELIPRARRDGPFAVLEDYLVRTNLLYDLIAVETTDSQRTVLALARLMRFVAEWQRAHPRDSLADFIAYLDVYQQVGGDLDTDLPGRVDVEGVQLMTVYQAKGLEYEAVVVPQLVEGQFPDLREETALIPAELLKQAPPREFAIAEERRLAFVAMTRAKSRLLLTGVDSPTGKPAASRFTIEIAPLDDAGRPPEDVAVERRIAGPAAEVDAGGASADVAAAHATTELLKLMPVPQAHERRFALRRRAVELIGALEGLDPEDAEARASLTAELVSVAEHAAGIADEARRNGLDPLTLTVLSRHAPAGRTLLELAPLPQTFSHSQLNTYLECPLRYAFDKVYRIPVSERKGYFEFGGAIHAAFEAYARSRRDALASGEPAPGYGVLEAALASVWQPTNYADAQAAEHYRTRAQPALRRFFDREVASLAHAVDFEVGFTLELRPRTGDQESGGDGERLDRPSEPPVRFYGVIDRIDRHPDGTIEITDYKTGRPRSQAQVDEDLQLSAYALALAEGAVRDPVTGDRLPPASRLTLYFTETDQAISTTRSAEQLEAFKEQVVEVAGRIRSGDFAATPSYFACGRCDYRLLCPSRWGSPTA
jgi:superfamily I DNA/RNA helicase/RecB family exonuclease